MDSGNANNANLSDEVRKDGKTPDELKKKSKKLYILLFISALAVTAYFMGTAYINNLIGDKIKKTASRYGCSVSWDKLSYGFFSKVLRIDNFRIERGEISSSVLRFEISHFSYPVKFPLDVHLSLSGMTVNLPDKLSDKIAVPFSRAGLERMEGDASIELNVEQDKSIGMIFFANLNNLGNLEFKVALDGNSDFMSKKVTSLNAVFMDNGLTEHVLGVFAAENDDSVENAKDRVLKGISRRIYSGSSPAGRRAILSQLYRFVLNPNKLAIRIEPFADAQAGDFIPSGVVGWRTLTEWVAELPLIFTSS